ncbi:MAG: M23 family metallopeptidase [Candidatus Ventricola sp.]
MSHVTAGFEYDDTLGRLQFVSNLLPESAMVFLSGGEDMQKLTVPTSAKVSHEWTQEEPWLEYACIGDVCACQDGEIMTIVKNRQDEYTVRVLHSDGYESIYSGLSAVHLKEQDTVSCGQQIGTSAGFAAFELRKDGLSVLPVFAGI